MGRPLATGKSVVEEVLHGPVDVSGRGMGVSGGEMGTVCGAHVDFWQTPFTHPTHMGQYHLPSGIIETFYRGTDAFLI